MTLFDNLFDDLQKELKNTVQEVDKKIGLQYYSQEYNIVINNKLDVDELVNNIYSCIIEYDDYVTSNKKVELIVYLANLMYQINLLFYLYNINPYELLDIIHNNKLEPTVDIQAAIQELINNGSMGRR